MSNAELPNLLSRGGRGVRGFRRGGGSRRGGLHGSSSQGSDETIQGTDTDAAVSRLSAVALGYLEDDPYAQYFVQSSPGISSRRLPIINRGTYTRTTALDLLLGRFEFQASPANGAPAARQIVSLGAGTDTRPFRLFARPNQQHLVYHELDFPTMTSKKLRTVRAVPALRTVLSNVSDAENDSWEARPSSGGEYWCHGLDLRQLIRDDGPKTLPGLRTDIPTMVVSECCLCYLEPSEAEKVVRWFTDRMDNVGVILYEPVKPDDPFGRMMVSNLAARHIRMPTLETFKEPSDQVMRLKSAGFSSANAVTVDEIFDLWISTKEKERVDSLEGLDEVEEWKLLAGHYVVAWGCKGEAFKSMDGFPD